MKCGDMDHFLIQKNALTFKIFPTILIEVTAYIVFLSLIYWLLRDDPISITMLILAWTIPILSFFYLSIVRTGLLELNICEPINTSRIVSTTFKASLYLWALGVFALALTMLIWYPMITALIPGFEISTLLSASLGDVLSQGLGVIGPGEELQHTQLVYGTLLPIFLSISVLLQIIFTIPLTSLAASLDGKTDFDPLAGIGSYFWSITLTLGVGYLILLILLINIILGTSTVFDISLTPTAILKEHTIVFHAAVVFFIIVFPLSFLSALHSSVSAKAYKRYINKLNEAKVVFLGVRIKPKVDSKAEDILEKETTDIVSLRKMREKRSH